LVNRGRFFKILFLPDYLHAMCFLLVDNIGLKQLFVHALLLSRLIEWKSCYFFFQAMLLLIYSDKLPDIYEVMGSIPVCSFTVMVQRQLPAADLYSLYRLKNVMWIKIVRRNQYRDLSHNTCPGRATPLSTAQGNLFEIYCKSDKIWEVRTIACYCLYSVAGVWFDSIMQPSFFINS
jgi:hypothetical protein